VRALPSISWHVALIERGCRSHEQVIPGEKMKIKLSVLINNSWAPDFNLGREKLEDILILHLEKGARHTLCCSQAHHNLPLCSL
jgi:phosphatidylinositol-bisphosphatase